MPVAVPTWRNVELIPEAMPARAGATTLTAVEASGTLTSPDPAPEAISPGMRCVQLEAAETVHQQQPGAASTNPAEIVSRTGTTVVSRPAAPAVTKVATVRNKRRNTGAERVQSQVRLQVQDDVGEQGKQRSRNRERGHQAADEGRYAEQRQVQHRPPLHHLDGRKAASSTTAADRLAITRTEPQPLSADISP